MTEFTGTFHTISRIQLILFNPKSPSHIYFFHRMKQLLFKVEVFSKLISQKMQTSIQYLSSTEYYVTQHINVPA